MSPDPDGAEIVARLFDNFCSAIVIGLHNLFLVLEEGNLWSSSKRLQQFSPVCHSNEAKIWAKLEALSQVHILPIVKHLTPFLRVCVVISNFKLLLVLSAQISTNMRNTSNEFIALTEILR